MRYDAEAKQISIASSELVNIAKRGISSVSREEEFSSRNVRLVDYAIKKLDGTLGEKLTLPFSTMGYEFILQANVDLYLGGVPSFIFNCEREKPTKALITVARAEAYLSSLVYMTARKTDATAFKIVYALDEDRFSVVEEILTKKRAEVFFKKCITSLSLYAKPEIERVTVRLPSMKSLSFPYKRMRDGQSEFIKSAYRNIARGTTLFATAPTGTGKTVSALFPAVRALGDQRCDKVFYFTPKTTTARAAEDCISLFSERGAKIRALTLSAKERLCENGLVCREARDLCANTKSNKLSDATIALYNEELTVTRKEDVRRVAKAHGVCPYELSLTYSELCDVIICDVNYLFDPDVYLRRYFTVGGQYAFLIDEAHNLPDRARDMFSSEISEEEIVIPSLSDCLSPFSETKKKSRELAEKFFNLLYPFVKEDIRFDENSNKVASSHTSEIPTKLYGAFFSLIKAVEKEISDNLSARDEEAPSRLKLLYDYLHSVKKFYSAMERFSDGYELFVFYENDKIRAKIFCIDPARDIAMRVAKGRAAVFFSATLSPLYYYKSVLGGDGSAEILSLPSPFVSEQLSVSIINSVSTRYSERERTLPAVLRTIAATVSAKRGNYMVFLPSFDYAEMLYEAFRTKYPKINSICQSQNMSAKEKAEFLSEFEKESHSYLVGFAVLGGIYSEGIDLYGDRLIGAIVVGIGLPGLSYEREAMCAYYDDKFEEGRQFAYIYPGMNRVLQAAGRVIRREDDKGIIVLIDDRFSDPLYKKIVPKLWDGMQFISDAKELKDELEAFWQDGEPK